MPTKPNGVRFPNLLGRDAPARCPSGKARRPFSWVPLNTNLTSVEKRASRWASSLWTPPSHPHATSQINEPCRASFASFSRWFIASTASTKHATMLHGHSPHHQYLAPHQHYYDDPYFFDDDGNETPSPTPSVSAASSSLTSYADTLSDMILHHTKDSSRTSSSIISNQATDNVCFHSMQLSPKKLEHEYHMIDAMGATVLVQECIHGKLHVVSGTLQQLFLKLADPTPQAADYMDAYLLNYVHFTSSLALLHQWTDWFQHIHECHAPDHHQKKTWTTMIHVIRRWIHLRIDTLGSDDAWMCQFDQFCNQTLVQAGFLAEASMLKTALYNEKYFFDNRRRISMAQFSIDIHVSKTSLFADMDPKDVARYLTLADSYLFQQLRAHHFLDAQWRDQPYDATPLSRLEETLDYIGLLTKRANMLHQWVLHELLHRCPSLKARKKMLTKWIHVAKLCLEWNNFHTSMILTMALMATPIQKMGQAWSALGHKVQATFDTLQQLVDVSNNMSCYRQALEHGFSPITHQKPRSASLSSLSSSSITGSTHRESVSSTTYTTMTPQLPPTPSTPGFMHTSAAAPVPTLHFLPVVLKDLVFLMDGMPGAQEQPPQCIRFAKYYDLTRYVQRVIHAVKPDYWFATHPPALPFLPTFDQYPSCPSLSVYKVIEQCLMHSDA
ncbi:ras guanine nucleotide exchange factor domain-containing protein [Gongronella butleri]|nr:ras guanine nucleotide exchange factor domain-containing protein [Gongronella butleri]